MRLPSSAVSVALFSLEMKRAVKQCRENVCAEQLKISEQIQIE